VVVLCADISNTQRYFDKPTTLYLLYLHDNLYKLGVTFRTVKRRYYQDKNLQYETLYEHRFTNGKEAYLLEQFLLEQFLLNKYKQYQYQGEAILIKGGNTEILELPDNVKEGLLTTLNKIKGE